MTQASRAGQIRMRRRHSSRLDCDPGNGQRQVRGEIDSRLRDEERSRKKVRFTDRIDSIITAGRSYLVLLYY